MVKNIKTDAQPEGCDTKKSNYILLMTPLW